MPLALDPAQTVPFSLAVDKDKAEEVRPTFLLGYLTCRQTLSYETLVKQAADALPDQAKSNTFLNQALALLIRGWKNLGDFQWKVDIENGVLTALDDMLTVEEKWEFAFAGRKAVRLSEDDKKKSRSQPAIATAESATAAETSATTSPQT